MVLCFNQIKRVYLQPDVIMIKNSFSVVTGRVPRANKHNFGIFLDFWDFICKFTSFKLKNQPPRFGEFVQNLHGAGGFYSNIFF